MADWFIIISLIVLGLGLIIVEVVLIPGTTIVGVLGFIVAGIAIYYTYSEFGVETGNYTLLATGLGFGILIFIAFKQNTWRRMALKSQITSRVNDRVSGAFKVGDRGVTISILKPIGNAEINGKFIEVTSRDEYIESGQNIEIIEKTGNKIIVKAIN